MPQMTALDRCSDQTLLIGSFHGVANRSAEQSADPVIRAGTNGLFYYSGIAFTRGEEPPSAGFIATYMDLNNDEPDGAPRHVHL